MKPFTLLATRSRTEIARIVVHANDATEAEALAKSHARNNDVIWETDTDETTVEVEPK